MKTEEYKLLDGRTIRAKYDRLGMCKISQENIESFVQEFNASYRQAKILEKIKENYALMKVDKHNKGRWINKGSINGLIDDYVCSKCNNQPPQKYNPETKTWGWDFTNFCPSCGKEMGGIEE